MSSYPPSSRARVRVRLACAALAALCAGALTACGPGGPKQKTADDTGDNTGNTGPSSGITLVAGNATSPGSRNDKGNKALFNTPRGIAVDASGNLFVADEGNRLIRKITPDGTVSTFAGSGQNGARDGTGANATFVDPTALAIDSGGNLFVTDAYVIRKITPAAVVTTLTTLSGGALGNDIQFQPAGIAVDASGSNLFVTTSVDTRRFAITNNRIATPAYLEQGSAFDYGLGTGVLAPRGIAVDSNGVVSVADLSNTISYARAGSNVLTHLAGVRGASGADNGGPNAASFGQIVALATDKSGTLYAADARNNMIRKISVDGETSTLAGRAGTNALVTGGLPGSLATVAGIAVDANGYLYVTSGNAVVKIVP
jgi:sugar lactone lactonase YvrE